MTTRFHTDFMGVLRPISTRTIKGESVDFVFYDGQAIRPKMLDGMEAAALYTPGWGRLSISQGGLSRGVVQSAKTHFDLDVADIRTGSKSKALVWKFSDNLFECGVLPFPRGYVRDSFQNNKHIHAIYAPGYFGHPQLSAQYEEWRRFRGDGLLGSAAYTGPTNAAVTKWADSMFNPVNRENVKFSGVVNVSGGLLGLDRDRKVKYTRELEYKLNFVAKVQRWGRMNYLTDFDTFYASDYITVID